MKRTNPIWGSISILIGVVIAILSLVRGVLREFCGWWASIRRGTSKGTACSYAAVPLIIRRSVNI